MSELDALTRDYRTTLLRYLPRHEEAALAQAYELGRRAVASGVSLMDLLRIHHDILTEVLRDTPGEMVDIVSAASFVLAEMLAPYDLARRAFIEPR